MTQFQIQGPEGDNDNIRKGYVIHTNNSFYGKWSKMLSTSTSKLFPITRVQRLQGECPHRTLLYTMAASCTSFRINLGRLLKADGPCRAKLAAGSTANTPVQIHKGYIGRGIGALLNLSYSFLQRAEFSFNGTDPNFQCLNLISRRHLITLMLWRTGCDRSIF